MVDRGSTLRLSPPPPHDPYSSLAPGEGCAGSITALPGAAEPACLPHGRDGTRRASSGGAPAGRWRQRKGFRAARGEGVGSPNRADTVTQDPPSARKPRAGPSSSARPARTGDGGCAERREQRRRHRRHGGSRSTLQAATRPPPAHSAPAERATSRSEPAAPLPSPQASAPRMRDIQERAGPTARRAQRVSTRNALRRQERDPLAAFTIAASNISGVSRPVFVL